MSPRINEALLSVLAEGKAEPALNRFIGRTLVAHYRDDGHVTQEENDELIAAFALIAMMRTSDGRKVLGLPSRRRGKEFDIHDYLGEDGVWEIGIDFHEGRLDKKSARARLEKYVGIRDQRTLDYLIRDLEEAVASVKESMGTENAPHTQPR